MEIVVYLAELIKDRKQVGIEGLGTLYKSKIPGRYDTEAHAFLPPSYTLQFSTELLETEALAQYISFKRNISVESANYYIEQFSNKAVQELSETNETQLGTLGKLSSVEGAIVFEPTLNGEAELLYFGLPKVDEQDLAGLEKAAPVAIEQVEDEFVEGLSDEAKVPTVTQEPLKPEEYTEPEEPTELETDEIPTSVAETKTEDDEVAVVVEEPYVVNSQAEVIDEAVNASSSETISEIIEENRLEEENPGMESTESEKAIETNFEEEPLHAENQGLAALLPTEINNSTVTSSQQDVEEERKSPYVKIVLAVLLVLLILALAFFLYPKMISASKEELDSTTLLDSLNRQDQANAVTNIDTLANAAAAVDTLHADTLPAGTTAAPDPVQPVVEAPAVTTYEIIIGSLANMKEAKKFIGQMKRKGINGKVVDSLTNAKVKVSIASFTDYEEARKERRKIVSKLNDPSIYIYTNKPKK